MQYTKRTKLINKIRTKTCYMEIRYKEKTIVEKYQQQNKNALKKKNIQINEISVKPNSFIGCKKLKENEFCR